MNLGKIAEYRVLRCARPGRSGPAQGGKAGGTTGRGVGAYRAAQSQTQRRGACRAGESAAADPRRPAGWTVHGRTVSAQGFGLRGDRLSDPYGIAALCELSLDIRLRDFHAAGDDGLVTFGRTTSPELGVGPVTEAVVYGGPDAQSLEPESLVGRFERRRGAAVAAGIMPIAHGSDGGGSVRIPASCCGLVGLKPTRARLPDGPASGEGWGGMSIDGVLSRSVRDTAAAMDATAGRRSRRALLGAAGRRQYIR